MRDSARLKERDMTPLTQVEVGTEQAVQVAQQVQVEGRGDAQRVVIGGLQHVNGFHKIHTDQQGTTRRNRVHLAQQRQGTGRVKVADARAGIKHQGPRAGQFDWQRQLAGKVQPDAHQVQCRMLALQLRQRRGQVVGRDVYGHVAARRQQREEGGSFGAVTGTQIDDHRARAS